MINYTLKTLVVSGIFLVFAACDKKEDTSYLITSPAAINSEEPNLVKGADGNIYITWIEKSGKNAKLKYSKWERTNWLDSELIAEGNDWFVNWADYPTLAVNKSGDMVAHYLQMSDTGAYTYDVKVVAKKNGDRNWSPPVKIHRDSVNAEHGFVSIVPLENNKFLCSWLDGRNTVSNDPEHDGHHGHGGGGPMTIRTATVSSDLIITDEKELDNRVCDCCQTGIGITDNGPVVVYRDRTEKEIRDMSIVRFVNENWTEPKTIYNDNWNIAGCPVNGPRVSSYKNNLTVAWFTASNGIPKVNLIFSKNAGESFDSPIQIDNGSAIGRVDVEMIDSETAFVSWMEARDIVATQVKNNGNIIKRYKLATSNEARNSGFPQITLFKDKIILAWTDSKDKKIRTKLIDL